MFYEPYAKPHWGEEEVGPGYTSAQSGSYFYRVLPETGAHTHKPRAEMGQIGNETLCRIQGGGSYMNLEGLGEVLYISVSTSMKPYENKKSLDRIHDKKLVSPSLLVRRRLEC